MLHKIIANLKYSTMKKNINLFLIPLFIGFTLLSCNPENGVEPIIDPVLPSANILVDDGSVGLVIDTRQIARKGYAPSQADISFPGALSSFSKKVDINPSTNVATLTIPAKDLTDAIKKQFTDGVGTTIKILGGASEQLAAFSDNVKVDNSNNPVNVDTELPRKFPKLVIDPQTPYFIQAVTDDASVNNKLYFLQLDYVREPGLDPVIFRDYYDGGNAYFKFFFEQLNDSVYHIKMMPGNDVFYLRMSGQGNFYSYYEKNKANINLDIYKYVVKRDENGLIKIKPLSGNPLSKNVTTWYGPQVAYSSSPDAYIPVRMVAANITWAVEDRGTEFNKPILPPTKLDFAYKSILKNCSPAVLTETVGKSESQTRSYTMGTQESLELYSSHEASVNVTAGAETETNLFGQKANVSLEVSVGYKYTTSSTKTTSNFWEQTVEETTEISRIRDVQIPAFTAVEVFDAIQVLENVKMPFVQKIRVRGKYNGTDALKGEDIVSQLLANQFDGVVSRVESDYVEISIRGTATINKFFEVESQVNELKGACDN
jgi:hypothetical protein